MGVEENRHATEIRRRLLMPPNAVPDAGIDLKRAKYTVSAARTGAEQELPQAPESSPPPPPSNILQFKPRDLTVMRLIEIVGKHSGFTVTELVSGDRKFPVTLARHVAIWLCVKWFPKRSLPQLAMSFQKDHTSLIHGRNRIRRYIDSNSPEGEKIRALVRLVEGEISEAAQPGQEMAGMREVPPTDHCLSVARQDESGQSELGPRSLPEMLEV